MLAERSFSGTRGQRFTDPANPWSQLSKWPVNGDPLVRTLTTHHADLVPGTAEFAIGRIETQCSTVGSDAPVAHRCSLYQILWFTEADGNFWLDLDCYRVKPNTMLFVSPGQIHAVEIRGRAAGYLIEFSTGFFSGSPSDQQALIQLPYFHGVGVAPVLYAHEEQAGVFTGACRRLEHEMEVPLYGQIDLLHSYMRILVVEAERCHRVRPEAMRTECVGMLLTKRFLQLVEAHYLDTSSVVDYADMLHVTPNHLIETVRSTVGLPPGKIIHDRLLLEAKRLLRYSELQVAEIASQLNFEDPSYFSRYFRKCVGLSPRDFRERPSIPPRSSRPAKAS